MKHSYNNFKHVAETETQNPDKNRGWKVSGEVMGGGGGGKFGSLIQPRNSPTGSAAK